MRSVGSDAQMLLADKVAWLTCDRVGECEFLGQQLQGLRVIVFFMRATQHLRVKLIAFNRQAQ